MRVAPYLQNNGNITLEFTVGADNVLGTAQVFNSSLTLAFGTYPLQIGGTPVSPQAPDEVTVQVNCANGDSIQDALDTLAVGLIIEVSGTCIENLVIKRDLVTLRGVNLDVGTGEPTDRIQGVPGADEPPHFGNVILIRDSLIVNVEGLILQGDNGVIAVYRSGASTDEDSGAITLKGVFTEGNSESDLVILSASKVILSDSRVGNVEVESSNLRIIRGSLTGGVTAIRESIVSFFGASQLPDQQNRVRVNSALFARCVDCNNAARFNSTLGDISVGRLSKALIRFGTTVQNLTCEVGSDAVCDGTETKASSTCGLCLP